MRIIVFAILFSIATLQAMAQKQTVREWADAIAQDLLAPNDLAKYSSEPIPKNTIVNFFFVWGVKDIEIVGDTLSMRIDHGGSTFCTKLKFRYITRDSQYFLVFSEPRTKGVLGTEAKFVDPWVKRESLCESK